MPSIFLIFLLLQHLIIPVFSVPLRWEWEPPDSLEKAEDDTVELHCPARGTPPPLFQWSFNAVPLREWAEDERRMLLDGGRVLRIRELKRDTDTGLYQCNATNAQGTLQGATFLNVQAFAPRFGHSDHRVWKVLRGSLVDLNCDVQAAPRARVRWVDANDTAIGVGVPGKLEFLPNHTLRLFDVSSADDGFYYCNVSNRYGLNRAMNRLEVFSPTYFVEVPQPPSLAVDAFDSLELRCRAVADPRLTVEYVWTRNGQPMEESASQDANGTSVLRLDQLRGRASGRIECAAVTDVDVKAASVELLVRDVPEPPELLRVDCSSGQHALIVWRRPEEHGSALSHFTVDARAEGARDARWQTLWEERVDADELMGGNGVASRRKLFKAAIPLSPWVHYTFRMFAHNAHGTSDPALAPQSAHLCTTPPDVPFVNPADVRAQGTEPDNLVIRWTPLPKNQWNAPGLKYLIRYRRMDKEKGEEGEEEEWHEFFVEDPVANMTTVREQPTFRPYLVQVRAVNSRGFSTTEPETQLGWSGEDVPTQAPTGLRLVAHPNYSSVELEWDPVPEGSVRGHFRGYRVDHWPSARPFLLRSVLVSNTSTRAIISGLQALNNYSAKVHVVNEQYESGPSNWIQFRTREGAPSKVHNLRVHSLGARSLLAIWEPPLQPNGFLRGYFLAFENLSSGRTEETYVLHRQLFYLHELLSPNTPFRVAVWAESGGGEGPRTWRHTRTWPLRDPDPPLFSVRSLSPTALRIHWLPSGNISSGASSNAHWRMSGSSFLINYTRQESAQWQQTDPIVLPQTVLDLRGLAEGTDYVLVGVAREGAQRRAQSKPLIIRTESSKRTPPFSTERLRSAAWFLAVLVACALTLALVAAMCLLAQHAGGSVPPGFAAIRMREKRFGPALRFSPSSGSEGTETTAAATEEATEWMMAEAQRKMMIGAVIGRMKGKEEEERKRMEEDDEEGEERKKKEEEG